MAGLIPFDPEAIISKLDIKIWTPIPTSPPDANTDTWVSQTLRNLYSIVIREAP